MPLNSEEKREYYRNYHKQRRLREGELYRERGRAYAKTFRVKNEPKLDEQRIKRLEEKIQAIKNK